MKFSRKLGLSIIAPLTLMACEAPEALYLYQPNGTVAQANADYFDCEIAAAQTVPSDTKLGTTPTYTTPTQTNCYQVGNSVQCNTTGGQTSGGQTYSYDANSELRTRYLARCLAQRGYSGTVLPICDSKKLSQQTVESLRGRLRQPSENACYVPITESVGNIVYTSVN